jgi:hypothetical protein
VFTVACTDTVCYFAHMPTLAFFPWAQIDEPFEVGGFALTPMVRAQQLGAIPAELLPAVRAVLVPYQVQPDAKLDRVPLLYRTGRGVCDDLDDDTAADLFAFRLRLAFAALAARDFFAGSSYCNSDNFELVAQGFSLELAGATAMVSRRRDGSVRNLISASARREPRPHHVASPAVMPRILDMPLLGSLEDVARNDKPAWPRLAEAIALFVGANTDSPSVTAHGELVDLVSTFGRLADSWNEDETVEWFVKALPGPSDTHLDLGGPKLATTRVQHALQRNASVRKLWLEDAYRLRSQHAHGRVAASPYRPIWTPREHLLLGAVALPLAVKAMLARDGSYSWSAADALLDDAFDALATLEPFAPAALPPDPEGDADHYPWREVITQIQLRNFVNKFSREPSDDSPPANV